MFECAVRKLLSRVCIVAVRTCRCFVLFASRRWRDGTMPLWWQSCTGFVHTGGGGADVVCRMQGYDHGPVGSSPCSFYGGSNLCGKLGTAIAMKDLKCSGGELENIWVVFVDISRPSVFISSVCQVQVLSLIHI